MADFDVELAKLPTQGFGILKFIGSAWTSELVAQAMQRVNIHNPDLIGIWLPADTDADLSAVSEADAWNILSACANRLDSTALSTMGLFRLYGAGPGASGVVIDYSAITSSVCGGG
jgi:hypothetical protein